MNVVDQVGTILQSEHVQETMTARYGTRKDDLDTQARRWLRLAGLFEACFPDHRHAILFSTPGRTEVGGNHTFHQHGRVLCASVDLDIIAVSAPNQDRIIRL